MRKVTGRTQAEYARLVGVAPRVLIDFERGAGNPTVATLEKILAPFGLELTVRRRRA
jgi:transcriptional regulator with XRE-family HTH domain